MQTEHDKTVYESITFLKILTNQSNISFDGRYTGTYHECPVVSDHVYWFPDLIRGLPLTFLGSGQEYNRRPTFPVSEYFKVINHIDKLLNKICLTVIPS